MLVRSPISIIKLYLRFSNFDSSRMEILLVTLFPYVLIFWVDKSYLPLSIVLMKGWKNKFR